MLRNPKHERFVMEAFLNGGKLTRAYMAANPGCTKQAARIHSRNLWFRNPEVMKRAAELRATMARRTEISVEKILTDFQDALDMAKRLQKPGDMISAATAQARLVGLMRDKTEIGRPGDFDNVNEISDLLEEVSRQAGPEAALALSKALGHAASSEAEPDQSLLDANPISDAMN